MYLSCELSQGELISSTQHQRYTSYTQSFRFSMLDMLCGYWQVKMEKKDREKNAFTTHEGLF